MGSAELGLPMASPLLLLLLLTPPTLSQFRSSYSTFYSPFSSPSYSSYSPSYYRGQTTRFSAPSSPPGPSFPTRSRFSSFAPLSYTGPPSSSYSRPAFRNRNTAFSNYLSSSNIKKTYPNFGNQGILNLNQRRRSYRPKTRNSHLVRKPVKNSRRIEEEVVPSWQGKVNGRSVTKCHDGKILSFRARCNQVKDCETGEDEADCVWHKRSSVPTISGVRQLRRTLRKNPNVLVEFFAPWCPACVNFNPQLEVVQKATKDIPLKVVKVNVDEDPELAKLFSVNSFPKLMIWSKRWGDKVPTYMFTQHRTYDKRMGLTARSVQAWIRQQFWLQS